MQGLEAVGKIDQLIADAARALAAGDAAHARATLRDVVRREPQNMAAWMNLAAAARAMADLPAAMAALDQALKLQPRNFFALLGKASLLERQGQARAAATAYGHAIAQAPPDSRLDPGTQRTLQHARQVHGRHVAELDEFISSALRSKVDVGRGRSAQRARSFIEVTLRKRPNYRQEPAEFFYPGLPAIEFYDRELFPFLPELEAQTPAILDELVQVLEEDARRLTPYIDYPDHVPLDQWAELNQSDRWSAYHLLLYGARVEANCRRVPRTMDAIAVLDQPQVPRRSPAAMFSVLEANTRIPPHTGVANTRLVLHLPLIVPPGCGFRVGGETREWQVGEAWVFDDTIEHEAWNSSGERRTILICDLWSPFLNETDRAIVAEVMNAMDAYNGAAPEAGL